MGITLDALVAQVANQLLEKNLMLATAESCTGGWVSEVLTTMPGSSRWFEGGVVSYSNAVKHRLLGVPRSVLEERGAVSEAVAKAMAAGAVNCLGSDIALAITGIAGPGGGSETKPVGLVWIGWALPSGVVAKQFLFEGDRQAVREQSVVMALQELVALLENLGDGE